MKRMRRFAVLLLALATILVTSQAVLAETQNVDGGEFVFNGSSITNADGYTADPGTRLEPGDTLTITYTYTNKDKESDKTEWYLSNRILETLEEGAAAGGGYSYTLVNHGKDTGDVTLFSSDAVGGQDKSIDEGLLQVNDAITGDGDEKFFHIDTLSYGESGTTQIIVKLEGESQPNSYFDKIGELGVAYAVEKIAPEGETIYKYVKTGDDNNLLLSAAIFLGAVILLILAILSFRKDRKDGEEA